MNQGRRIAEAKKSVIEIYDSGYTTPVQRKDIKVLGQSALGALYTGINAMGAANYATDHDVVVAKKLAYVMCGGDLSEPPWYLNNIYSTWSGKHFFLFVVRRKHWKGYRVF